MPALARLLDEIHSEAKGAVKWALGIFDNGDKKAGNTIYLYNKSKSERASPMIVNEAIRTINWMKESLSVPK